MGEKATVVKKRETTIWIGKDGKRKRKRNKINDLEVSGLKPAR